MENNITSLAKSASAHPFPGLESALFGMNVVALAACILLLLIAFIIAVSAIKRGHKFTQAMLADDLFLEGYRHSPHALSLFQDERSFPDSPRHSLYEAGCRELAHHLVGTDHVDNGFPMRLRSAGRITPSHMATVQRAMESRALSIARPFAAGLGGLGVRLLPVIGLLGTILSWMETMGVPAASPQVASCFIPLALSILFYLLLLPWHNALVVRVQIIAAGLEDFVAELSRILDRAYVDHRKPLESLPSLGTMGFSDGPTFSLPPSDQPAAPINAGRKDS
jgi:biopolymer transport protein ExbB/TolQ